MHYRGGGVSHTSTHEATDWFLKDWDLLNTTASKQAWAAESQNTPMDLDQGDGKGEQDEDKTEGGERQERETIDEEHGDGGSINADEVNECESEVEEDEIDEEMDYGYVLDEEELDGSEEDNLAELAEDGLGAEDGEEVKDELDNLGCGAL